MVPYILPSFSLCLPSFSPFAFNLGPWRSADRTIVVSAPHWAPSTPPTARCASQSTAPCLARARNASRRPTTRGRHGWSPPHSRDRGRPKRPKAGATNKGATRSPPFRRATAERLWAKWLRAIGRNGGAQYPTYPEIPGRRWISVGVRGPLGPPLFGRSSRAYRNSSSRETQSAPATALGQGHESLEKVPWPLKKGLRFKGERICVARIPLQHLQLIFLVAFSMRSVFSLIQACQRYLLEARGPLRLSGRSGGLKLPQNSTALLPSHARASRSRFREWVIFKSLGRVCSRRDCRESPANPTDNQRLLRLSQKKCVTSWVKWALVEPSRSPLCWWHLFLF